MQALSRPLCRTRTSGAERAGDVASKPTPWSANEAQTLVLVEGLKSAINLKRDAGPVDRGFNGEIAAYLGLPCHIVLLL